ncbi:MFS transporter [Streptomyces sp. NPDC049577]|uniref:MFS transporter n=1 Tax=Streptomyces sp. NPDC049577 TaxID=3155153 RepID=UPI003429008A
MLINRDFRRLWLGQALSLVGDYAFDTAVLLWVSTEVLRGKAYAPTVTAVLLMTVSVATIAVAPVAGTLVDRWEKKRTMLRSELFRFAVVGAVAAAAFLPAGSVPAVALLLCIGVAVALTSAAAQFFRSSRFVVISDVVPAEQHGRAFSYTQSASALASIAGPAVAAPLVMTAGVRWVLAFDALSFLVSYAAIRGVTHRASGPGPATEAKPRGRAGLWCEFRASARLLFGNRVLRGVLVAAVLMAAGTGALNALEVYFVPENLHASPSWFGTLEALFGAGTIAGALAGGRLGDRAGHTRVFQGSLLLFGLLLIVYSRATAILVAAVVSVLFGLALGALNAVASPLIVQQAPRDHLGRMMSVFDPVAQLASLAALGLSGVLAGTVLDGFHGRWAGLEFGRLDTILLTGGVCTVLTGLWALVGLRPAGPASAVAPTPPPARANARP